MKVTSMWKQNLRLKQDIVTFFLIKLIVKAAHVTPNCPLLMLQKAQIVGKCSMMDRVPLLFSPLCLCFYIYVLPLRVSNLCLLSPVVCFLSSLQVSLAAEQHFSDLQLLVSPTYKMFILLSCSGCLIISLPSALTQTCWGRWLLPEPSSAGIT